MLSAKILLPRVLAGALALASYSSHTPSALPALQVGSASAVSASEALVLPLRALIVGGGPSREQSQAGVEGNARYVASLMRGSRSARLLWADGSRTGATVAAVPSNRDKYLSRLALAFALSEDWPEEPVGFRAPALPQLDGAVSKANVEREIASLGPSLQTGETALLYFTGHGSAGRKARSKPSLQARLKHGIEGGESEDDFENTIYWMWNERPLSVRQAAPLLEPVPASNPLVLVMVQCHAGGFANLIFQDGDPSRPLARRDVCGFFAATADRMSSGCTPLVNESESEDFTSHFFGALSGRGRGQRRVLQADFNRDGRTSMLEAFAYASLHDRSIDVPTCTSQQFLQRFFPESEAWYLTPFSRLEARAAPWQKAMLQGLSRELNLSGEARLDAASRQALKLAQGAQQDSEPSWSQGLAAHSEELRSNLVAKFLGLNQRAGSAPFAQAHREALKYLQLNPRLWRSLARDIERESAGMESGEVREAMLWRFVDAGLTLIAEQKLRESGTPAQKAAFARLRASEERSLFAAQPQVPGEARS